MSLTRVLVWVGSLAFSCCCLCLGGENKSQVSLINGKIVVSSAEGNAYVYDTSKEDKIKKIGRWIIKEEANSISDALAVYKGKKSRGLMHRRLAIYDEDGNIKYEISVAQTRRGKDWVVIGDNMFYISNAVANGEGVVLLNLADGSKKNIKEGMKACFFEEDGEGDVILIVETGNGKEKKFFIDGDELVEVDEDVSGVSDCNCAD